MTATRHPPATPFDASTWSDDSARAALQLIAASVAQMVGFEVAVISAVRDDVLVSVAIEGDDEVRRVLGGMRTPLSNIRAELEVAEDWGRFKFVDHRHAPSPDEFRWVPDLASGDGPGSWHPEDALLAPLYDEDGHLCGLLSIDVPLNGRRPDRTQLGLLERYAEQAERALVNAFEREQMEQQLRLTEAAREIVRLAVSQPDVDKALEECQPLLLQGFRADALSIRTYPTAEEVAGGSPNIRVSDRLRQLLRTATRRCWDLQRTAVLTPTWHDRELLSEQDYVECLTAQEDLGYPSTMIVPIGAANQCLGHVILMRKDARVPWTREERTSAIDMTKDIGLAISAARNLTRERRLVAELRELDIYKSQLLSTVSHELKNPLGAIAGHLELITGAPELSAQTAFSIAAMTRATARITSVVHDLLTLAQLEDPDTRESTSTLDLRPAIAAAFDSAALAAERRHLRLRLVAPEGPLPVAADEVGLERVLTNLVGNAVKYTDSGAAVTLGVTYPEGPAREVEIAVHDEGIGISAADQDGLFSEFFRSTNPVALAEPGTGLGLAISARIVESHGGRITVESELGVGSTFRVFLPLPA